MMSGMRKCGSCGAEKSVAEFYRRTAVCKPCHRERVRLRRLTNPAVQMYDRERARRPERRAYTAQKSRAWREKNPDAYRAHNAVNAAVRNGTLKKRPCEICGETSVHAHHKDYSKPLEVVWLCPRCHLRLHALFPEIELTHKKHRTAT